MTSRAADATSDSPTTTPVGPRHDPDRRGFGSDNQAGVHPDLLAAIATANGGHVGGYGEDPYTAAFGDLIRRRFGPGARGFPVFSGTGANVVALAAAAGRWRSVVCAETAHIHTDEGAAPEMVAAVKLLPVPTADGRLTPDAVEQAVARARPLHQAPPTVLSLTQATELGTVYTAEEVRALTATAHRLGLVVHVDGTRLANACARLDLPLRALTSDVGVDVLSLGGTKTGMLGGDAVVVLSDAVAPDVVEQVRKGAGQLGSKLRFVSAQFEALFGGDLWLRLARHANDRAADLAARLGALDGVRVVHPVEANAVFVTVPEAVAAMLGSRFGCHPFDPPAGAVRLMCAWDTTEQDVDALVEAVETALRNGGRSADD